MGIAQEQKVQKEDLGTAGKFTDERFFRKSPAKPYDRPPTDTRTSGSNSWILKFVDPAQRLISSGSQILFSSVFQNLPHRLTSRPSSQESSQSIKDDKKTDSTDPFEVRVATNVCDNRKRSDQFGMMELEKTLKKKTFTRSEIDHLTTLLHSRTIDLPVVNEEKRFKFISSMPESNSRKEEFAKIPTSEVGMGRQSNSTPILSSSVLDEDISSPAEIAKAYMGSRQPKVRSSVRSLQAQGLWENSAFPSSISFPSKSTDMSFVATTTSQGVKRRSSCLDNDFRSIVPLRRIQRKPNFLPSKGLSLPIFAPVNGLCFEASQSSKFWNVQHFPSSIRNSQLSLKPKKFFARKLIMNMDGDSIPGPGSSSTYTPSRSYKMASKILEQLDKLTPPKEKVSEFNLLPVGERSPPTLSPSMVRGLPLRSLDVVDLPRSEKFVDDNKQSNGLHWIPLHGNRDHTFQKQEKIENMKPLDSHHRLTALVKDSGPVGSSKDSMTDLGVPASAAVKSIIQPPENKRSFQMWSDKDSLDHDESSADRVEPAKAEVREEGDISLAVRKTTASEALAPAKLQTTSEVIVGSPLNRSSDLKTSDDPIDDEKDTSFTFQNASSLCTTSNPKIPKAAITSVRHSLWKESIGPMGMFDDKLTSQQEIVDSAPTYSFVNKDLPGNKQSDPSIFSFGNNISPPKQPNASSTVFDVGNKVTPLVESRAASENGNKAPYAQCNAAPAYLDVQESVYLNADTSSNYKPDRSCRTCNYTCSSSASISAGLAFSFSSPASNRSLNNGPSISSPFLFSPYSQPTVFTSQSSSSNIFLSITSASKTTDITATDNHLSTSGLPPTSPAEPGFIFGFSTVLSTTVSSAPSTMGLETCEDKIKQDTSLHDANNADSSSISTSTNSRYSMFSFSAAATPSSVNSQLSTPTVSSATELSAPVVSAGNKFGANTGRMSTILGSSVSLVSLGLLGKASVSSGISFGCCSSPASELLNPGSRPSEFPNVGFTSAPTTSTVGTSNVSTSNKPLVFEPSEEPSFSSIFPITSAAAAAGSSSKPVSSNSQPTVSFRVSSGKNDCEKRISPPSSGFSFGLTTTSESNPFQSGKQQTLAEPQKSPPFIARGGSFSLGGGGGDMANRRFVKVKRRK